MASTAIALSGDCKGFTDRERKFVARYCIHLDTVRAAREAGYKNPPLMGPRLIRKEKIARAIGNVQRKDLEKDVLTREAIIHELSLLAMRDPLEMCDEEGRFVVNDLRQIPPHIRRCIDGMKVNQRFDEQGNLIGQEFELKLVGKATAFRMLMEHFGMFAPQKHKIEVGIDWDALFMEKEVVDDIQQIEREIGGDGS